MAEIANEITFTIPVTHAANRHIEDLQATLTKRNARIEQLTAQLEEALTGEPNQRALAGAYKRGWQDASNLLMSTTADAARALGKLRKEAFDIYLQSERRDFDGSH